MHRYKRILRSAVDVDDNLWNIIGLVVHCTSSEKFETVQEVQRELAHCLVDGGVDNPDDYLYQCYSSYVTACLEIACKFGYAEKETQ